MDKWTMELLRDSAALVSEVESVWQEQDCVCWYAIKPWDLCGVDWSVIAGCEQSKEKLIASLKESPSSGGKSVSDSAALVSELESVRQERDILHDELRSSQHTVDGVRSELAVSHAALLLSDIMSCWSLSEL